MDLQAIEARLAAATPGPWKAQDFVAAPTEDAGSAVVKQGNGGLVAYALRSGAVEHEWYDKPQCDADAEFIAHAPEDIRALIDVVKRLRRFLNTGAKRVVAVEEIEGLRAQVEAAKAAQLQIEEVKALHCDVGASQGYSKSGRYEVIEHCCGQCGSFGEYGAKYPCPTMRALGVTE